MAFRRRRFAGSVPRNPCAKGRSVTNSSTTRSTASGAFYGVEAAGETILPGPEARLAPTTFDTWLAVQSATGRSR